MSTGTGRNRVFDVLVRSSRDGYLVRITELLPKRGDDKFNSREYAVLRKPPAIGGPFGEKFFGRRVRLRNEMIGWIKAQLSDGAVDLLRELPCIPGRTITRFSGDYDLTPRSHPMPAPIADGTKMEDDLSDLDDHDSWRSPTQDDMAWVD